MLSQAHAKSAVVDSQKPVALTQHQEELPHPPDPIAADQITPTLIMVGVAMLGGLANFYHKMRTGHTRVFNVVELVGELFISGVAGVFAYWSLKGFGVNPYLVAAGVGISGHMGSRALFLIERHLEQRAGLDAKSETKAKP